MSALLMVIAASALIPALGIVTGKFIALRDRGVS